MTTVKVEVDGDLPRHPKDKVEALEAVAKALTKGPPEAIMALVTAAMHLHRAYQLKTLGERDETLHFAEMLGYGLGCVDEWWPDAGKDMPDDVMAISNDDLPPGGTLQ